MLMIFGTGTSKQRRTTGGSKQVLEWMPPGRRKPEWMKGIRYAMENGGVDGHWMMDSEEWQLGIGRRQ
jgi:hypothetical protein